MMFYAVFNIIFIEFEIVTCKLSQFGRVVWERVMEATAQLFTAPRLSGWCTGLENRRSLVQSLSGPNSFQGLMIAIVTGSVPLSVAHCFDNG